MPVQGLCHQEGRGRTRSSARPRGRFLRAAGAPPPWRLQPRTSRSRRFQSAFAACVFPVGRVFESCRATVCRTIFRSLGPLPSPHWVDLVPLIDIYSFGLKYRYELVWQVGLSGQFCPLDLDRGLTSLNFRRLCSQGEARGLGQQAGGALGPRAGRLMQGKLVSLTGTI